MDEVGKNISESLAKNRAEELGFDVWEHFVVPPFFEKLDLKTASKPRLIIGGRGCGKTMLLRYLSHQSMFSKERTSIPSDEINHVGLYWRTDTNFASLMTMREVPEDVWRAAFSHFAALILSQELLSSLRSIQKSFSEQLTDNDLSSIQFRRLNSFDPALPASVGLLEEYIQDALWQFESWVSNVRNAVRPVFLPGREFLLALIKLLKKGLPSLSATTFFVYVDEYENLQPYQQQIINTWLKHSESPLIFNLAMKKNAFETLATTGPESISDIHDFRIHDLEDYILQDQQRVFFFAELLLLKITTPGVHDITASPDQVRRTQGSAARHTESHRKKVIASVKRILPDLTHEDLAQKAFADSTVHNKIAERIEVALRNRQSPISIECFLSPRFPAASIIVPALLNRRRNLPEEILLEFDKLTKGEANKFTGPTNWIHNNFVGAFLQLYERFNRPCPFYSGFDTFISLSKGNIRHFFELCYKSFVKAHLQKGALQSGFTIDPLDQAAAALQASIAFLGEIRSFGPHGNRLHRFVIGLGTLFAAAHQKPSLSETEQSHFSIVTGRRPLSRDEEQFLREAVKWSVLFEEKETKVKTEFAAVSSDYVLNPIYAPYFHISYRKKRKLEITTDMLRIFINSEYNEISQLIRDRAKEWGVQPGEHSPTLFAHLEE